MQKIVPFTTALWFQLCALVSLCETLNPWRSGAVIPEVQSHFLRLRAIRIVRFELFYFDIVGSLPVHTRSGSGNEETVVVILMRSCSTVVTYQETP
jgi:hypothetical protein